MCVICIKISLTGNLKICFVGYKIVEEFFVQNYLIYKYIVLSNGFKVQYVCTTTVIYLWIRSFWTKKSYTILQTCKFFSRLLSGLTDAVRHKMRQICTKRNLISSSLFSAVRRANFTKDWSHRQFSPQYLASSIATGESLPLSRSLLIETRKYIHVTCASHVDELRSIVT